MGLIERLQVPHVDESDWFTDHSFDEKSDNSEGIIDFWQTRVRKDRNDADARYQLAEAFRASGDPMAAAREWRKTLVLQTDHGPAALRLAQMCFRSGEDREGVRWLKRIALRRPQDDRILTAILGLCLFEAEVRHARALAEQFLDAGQMTPDRAEVLFHVFSLFDDVGRARRAAGLDGPDLPVGPQRLWLAARAAIWAGDSAGAITCLSALSEVAPGGQVMARKAVAQSLSGDHKGAAVTLASATQMFLASPQQLSDLAAALDWPDAAPLRQVVISTLQRLASSDAAAAAALALAHYRLGNWNGADRALKEVEAREDWPQLIVVASNLSSHLKAHGALPHDAADFAFNQNIIRLDIEAVSGDTLLPEAPALLVLGGDLDPCQRETLLQTLRNAAPTVAVIEHGESRADTTGGRHAALLSGCFFGVTDYQFGAAGEAGRIDQAATQGGLGYLPPQLAAEIIWFRDHISRIGPRSVHVAGTDTALAAGLGAILAGVGQIRFHAGPEWIERGTRRQSFFRSGMKRLLSDRRCRLLLDTVIDGTDWSEDLQPVREPLLLPVGIDAKSVRAASRGIHRHRAAEALQTTEAGDPPFLISVTGLTTPDEGTQFINLAGQMEDTGCRFVVWVQDDALWLSQQLSGMKSVSIMRWPSNAGAFLIHCDLGTSWANEGALSVLAHAAVRVPVLQVGSDPWAMPSLGPVLFDSVAARLKSLVGQRETLVEVGEQARLWIQANHPLRRSVRAIQRLDGFPEMDDGSYAVA